MQRSALPLILAALWAGCDSALPTGQGRLVVEAYLQAEAPLPDIRLRETRPLGEPYPLDATTAAEDADVAVSIGAESVAYRAAPGGQYEPARPVRAASLFPAGFEARWQGSLAAARSIIPPPFALDSVRVRVPPEPVDGIILDSLFIDPGLVDTLRLDSLQTGAASGLVYLVEVSAYWRAHPAIGEADSTFWLHTQLRHDLPGSRRLDDFFLRPEQLFPERDAARAQHSGRRWTGVYAVPVASRQAPVPRHRLRVAVVRSTLDYARFISGTRDPERREPPGNIENGIGIFVGIALDSVHVMVQ